MRGDGGLSTRWASWVWLALYVGIVYASSPFTPALAEALEGSATGRVLLAAVPLLAAATLVPIAVYLGFGRVGRRSIVPWLVIAGLYAAVWIGLCEQAVEGVHLAQYGLMSILGVRALRAALPLPVAYVGGVLLTVAASWGNELIQSMLPNRVYDLRDILLDGLSAVLGVMLVRQLERP